MPLVPPSVFSSWYHRDHWVYRNFAYLFQNPLWSGTVPKGASLCPLWWSALFSLLIFRPFVYLLLGFRLLIKTLQLGRIIEWTDSVVQRVFGPSRGGLGSATFCAFGFSLAGLLVLLLLGTVALRAYDVGCLASFTLPFICVTTLFGSLVYVNSNGHKPDRCPVEVYVRLVVGLSVAVAVVLHPAFAYFSFISIPVAGFTAVFHDVLWSIVICGSAHGIWIALQWIWGGILVGAKLVVWSIASIAVLGVAGWIAGRFGLLDAVREQRKTAASAPDSRRGRRAGLLYLARRLYQDDRENGCRNRSECWWGSFVANLGDLVDPFLVSEASYDEVRAKAMALAIAATNAELEAQAACDAKCRAVTAAIARPFTPVGWVWKRFRTACAYGWAMVKARKQGACPYFHFTE